MGWRFSDNLDTYGFVTAKPGGHVYISNASEGRTYKGIVGNDGRVTELKVFADRGGESVAWNAKTGMVVIANGQVLIYSDDGKFQYQVDVPERPIQVLLADDRDNTIFILTHHALYAVTDKVRPAQ